MNSARALTIALGSALVACATPAAPGPETRPSEVTELSPTADPYVSARSELVESGVRDLGVDDPRVLDAMRTVPRHLFVPAEYIDLAYANTPLPIGYGQTISQPYIVGLMTQELGLDAGDRVLEIGTGSAYQAAVLAELGVEVYSIEIIEPLHEQAAGRLAALGYGNVQLRRADGYFGWEEAAPFDAIIVTAAPDHVPQPLVSQLVEGGVMVIPVGPVGGYQELWRIRREGPDELEVTSLGGVSFVPLVRTAD